MHSPCESLVATFNTWLHYSFESSRCMSVECKRPSDASALVARCSAAARRAGPHLEDRDPVAPHGRDHRGQPGHPPAGWPRGRVLRGAFPAMACQLPAPPASRACPATLRAPYGSKFFAPIQQRAHSRGSAQTFCRHSAAAPRPSFSHVLLGGRACCCRRHALAGSCCCGSPRARRRSAPMPHAALTALTTS